MEKPVLIPVLMSGGQGTRLWPVSRAQLPKQFCRLLERTLFDSTLQRLSRLGSPWALTTRELQVLTEKSFRQHSLPFEQIVLEPEGRNTAPAIALLCHVLKTRGQSQVCVGIFPADHLIEKEDVFLKAIEVAALSAQQHDVVTLGIQPTYPATGFGYIEVKASAVLQPQSVVRFCEKPDLAQAQKFIQEGRFFWNAGIFVFQVQRMWNLLAHHVPEITTAIEQLGPDLHNLSQVYARLPKISIDYAVMEKAKDQVCIPCDIGWNDLGSWDDLADYARTQSLAANQASQLEVNSQSCFAFADTKKLIAFLGVDDLVVVDTADACLVTRRGATQNVRHVLEKLREQKSSQTENPYHQVRPWGQFEVLRDSSEFKSKIITVEAGAQLSYQSHNERSEHWVVVRGQGEVVLNEQSIPVQADSYVHIPVGAKHRMRNTGQEPLIFIEVQTGTYFGEDDIIRYQDDYARVLIAPQPK